MLAIVPTMPTVAATGLTTFRAPALWHGMKTLLRLPRRSTDRQGRCALGDSAGPPTTRAAKGRWSPLSSGCHCTPSTKEAPGSSTASMTPSAATRPCRPVRCPVRRSIGGASRARWRSAPKTSAVREPGIVVTSTSPNTDGAGRWPSWPTTSGRCWCSVPPSSTLRIWQPAAHGQHGQVDRQGRRQERALTFVADRIDPTHAGPGGLAVEGRVDIPPPVSTSPSSTDDHLGCPEAGPRGGGARRRQEHGSGAGRGHQLVVRLGQDRRRARSTPPRPTPPRRWKGR